MSAQMHVTKHDYRKLSVSLARVHPSSTCHRSRLQPQPQPSLFVFLLLPGFDATPSRSTFSTSSKRPFCSRRRFNSSNCYWSVEIFPHSFSYLPREMRISVKASILASGVQPWMVQNQSSSCRTSIADMIELLIVLNYIGCQEVTTDNATIA